MEPNTQQLGPDNATLQVKTYREGMAQKVGHDLVIDVTGWQATVTTGEDSTPVSVELSADPTSMRVRDGHGGAKPLSDKDRGEIVKNIEKKVLGRHSIAFRSTGVERRDGRLQLSGELEMGGTARPVSLEVDMGADGRVGCTVPLQQSQWGIKPYTALMGALKVRDDVEVVLDAKLPTA
jgi:polyisoprenoid-binding protein YceI